MSEPAAEESLLDTIKRVFSQLTNSEAKDKDMRRPKPKDVPLGTGIAGQGKQTVSGRQAQIDAAVDEMD